MSMQTRIKKLEHATGINEPCEVCDLVDDYAKRAVTIRRELGIPVSNPQGRAPWLHTCPWCLRQVDTDIGDFTLSERVLFERRDAAGEQGRVCAPENATLDDEIDAAVERVQRKLYGPHYETGAHLLERFKAEIDRIVERRVPRFHYLCRVEGCACGYPKTEEEFRANVQAKGLALV